MDYNQALDYIYSFIDYETIRRPGDTSGYDLRRIFLLLERLGNPHLRANTVHIAGSKGKGSVAAMIASALVESGYKTGLFTSPHLHVYNERIMINGKPIPDAEIVTLVEQLKPEVEKINNKAKYGRLTTFELTTTLGFMYFAAQKVDFQVIEVGLGGRLDATNVVKPEVCVITSISLEHTDILGDTLPKIAAEKAGIIKPGCVVVTSHNPPEVEQVFEQTCLERGAKLYKVGKDISWEPLNFDSNRQSLRVKGRLDGYEILIPLLGQYQMENAATAVATLEILHEKGFNVTHKSIIEGLAKVYWPGRLQVLGRHPLLVVDGAHNPDSAAKLAHALRQYFSFNRAILVIGVLNDKDISGIANELAPLFNEVVATQSTHPRAMPPEKLVAEFKRRGISASPTGDISEALPLALSMAGKDDLICVTGSLYIVAAAIEQAEQVLKDS